ncbi:hypothetical protein SAMN02194393_01629 [Maledivibacter halophilus]|uniref:Uncharacterized protein n=1 Tax=Maledivibacter halophilus TaxID=36842 RepID=A0A1T5K5B2_9FIRM|nr:hypothetical protein SAMN02194393_01629 [Maledivibacter halophilus]
MEVLMVIIMIVIYFLLDASDYEKESASSDFVKQKMR